MRIRNSINNQLLRKPQSRKNIFLSRLTSQRNRKIASFFKEQWIVTLIMLTLEIVIIADDITVTLDSADGSSAFSLRDSGGAKVAHIDSDGNMMCGGTIEVNGAGDSVINGNLGIGIRNPTEKIEASGAVKIGAAAGTADGTIRYSGGDFEGRKGGTWVSLAAQGETDHGNLNGLNDDDHAQ